MIKATIQLLIAAFLVLPGPQIVHARDVVGMPVRKDEYIELFDSLAQTLQAEFRGGIDLDVQPVHHDVNRGTCSPVTHVGGRANRAMTRDHRHALRRARAEKNHFHVVHAKPGSSEREAEFFRQLWFAHRAAHCTVWTSDGSEAHCPD